MDAGHHSRQQQQQPQQYQQPPQPAGSTPPEPPLQLDWGRLVRVSAEFVEEMDGPPEQAPDQQQRVELRFWYRVSAALGAAGLLGRRKGSKEQVVID